MLRKVTSKIILLRYKGIIECDNILCGTYVLSREVTSDTKDYIVKILGRTYPLPREYIPTLNIILLSCKGIINFINLPWGKLSTIEGSCPRR